MKLADRDLGRGNFFSNVPNATEFTYFLSIVEVFG
jgi:hypothetical protein